MNSKSVWDSIHWLYLFCIQKETVTDKNWSITLFIRLLPTDFFVFCFSYIRMQIILFTPRGPENICIVRWSHSWWTVSTKPQFDIIWIWTSNKNFDLCLSSIQINGANGFSIPSLVGSPSVYARQNDVCSLIDQTTSSNQLIHTPVLVQLKWYSLTIPFQFLVWQTSRIKATQTSCFIVLPETSKRFLSFLKHAQDVLIALSSCSCSFLFSLSLPPFFRDY